MNKEHHEEEKSSIENIAENVEKRIDEKMTKLARGSMVEKFMSYKLVNNALESKIVKDINSKIKPSL